MAALSELVLQTEMQLLDLLPNSPEGKTSSAKEKPGRLARRKRAYLWTSVPKKLIPAPLINN
jgi:hypothetical protein